MNSLPVVTVASVGQYINTTLQAAVSKTLNGETMLRVVGTLGELRRSPYNIIYGVQLTNNGVTVFIDVPCSIAAEKHLKGGESVIVTGALNARMNSQKGYMEVRITVSDIVVRGNNMAETHVRDRATIAGLKHIGMHRYSFPASIRPSISLITSRSNNAQVDNDFLMELGEIAKDLTITKFSVNMQSPHEIASAIFNAQGEIVVLIRGGGDSDQFLVFEDEEVVKALATKDAYRIVGLGHTGNSTLLDLVADFSANTPTQAGGHIRDRIARNSQIAGDFAVQNSLLTQQIRERDTYIRTMQNDVITKADPRLALVDRAVRIATLVGVWASVLAIGYFLFSG